MLRVVISFSSCWLLPYQHSVLAVHTSGRKIITRCLTELLSISVLCSTCRIAECCRWVPRSKRLRSTDICNNELTRLSTSVRAFGMQDGRKLFVAVDLVDNLQQKLGGAPLARLGSLTGALCLLTAHYVFISITSFGCYQQHLRLPTLHSYSNSKVVCSAC